MGVQGAGTGSSILILGEQPFQFGVLFCPSVLVGVKSICKTAPAHILGKHLLFLGGGTTVFLFQLEQGADGFDISGIFLLCAALAQMVVRDVEISGRLRRRFSIQGFIQGNSIREGLHLSVHYVRDGQFVQFFVRKWRFVLVRLMHRSEIDRQVVQMDVARLAQQPFQIFLAFRAGNRIDLIRVTKLDVQSSDSFDRKILTVQTDCIAHTVITLFWESRNRFIFCQKLCLFHCKPIGGGSFIRLFFQSGAIGFGLLLVCKLRHSVIICIVALIEIIPDSKKLGRTSDHFADRKTLIFRHLGFLVDGFCLLQHFIHTLARFILPQTVLELSFVDNFVIPRLSVCAGVDANIRFADIANGALDGSSGQINHYIVTDFVAVFFLYSGTLLLFFIRQVAVGLDHQVDILFHLRPFQGDFLVVRVMVKFQSLPVVVHKTPASVQKIVGVPTNAVLLCQCFGTEFAVRLGLVQRHNALFAACKP